MEATTTDPNAPKIFNLFSGGKNDNKQFPSKEELKKQFESRRSTRRKVNSNMRERKKKRFNIRDMINKRKSSGTKLNHQSCELESSNNNNNVVKNFEILNIRGESTINMLPIEKTTSNSQQINRNLTWINLFSTTSKSKIIKVKEWDGNSNRYHMNFNDKLNSAKLSYQT